MFITVFFKTPKRCLFDTAGYQCGCIMCLTLYFELIMSPLRYGSQLFNPILEMFLEPNHMSFNYDGGSFYLSMIGIRFHQFVPIAFIHIHVMISPVIKKVLH